MKSETEGGLRQMSVEGGAAIENSVGRVSGAEALMLMYLKPDMFLEDGVGDELDAKDSNYICFASKQCLLAEWADDIYVFSERSRASGGRRH